MHIALGKIPARKEQGLKGLEWRIYPSGIPQEREVIEHVSEVEIDGNQTGTNEGKDWNHNGTGEVPGKNQAGGDLGKLLEVIKIQAEKLEAANFRIGI